MRYIAAFLGCLVVFSMPQGFDFGVTIVEAGEEEV